MIIAFGSFIGLVFHICKNARKTADFKNAKITHQAMLKQQDELENLKDMIMEKQAYIDQYLDCAMELGNNKQYEEMTVLISSLTSHVKRNYPDSFCKNALLNTLLQEKKVIADQSKIQCQFRIILHGHGLTIIEDIVSQYHGTCKWLDQKNSFSSELLFQLLND